MTAPQMPKRPEVVTRTMFTMGEDEKWYWETKAIDNSVVANGEGGYEQLRDAIAGYFAQQNVAYGLMEPWPSDYGPLKKLPGNQFQINKFLA